MFGYMKESYCLGGDIADYFWRIEFQKRGSPHVHMLL